MISGEMDKILYEYRILSRNIYIGSFMQPNHINRTVKGLCGMHNLKTRHLNYSRILPGAFTVLAIFIVISLVVPDAAAQIERPLVTRERYDTMPFSAGSIVIPMDEKQNDTTRSFGLIHALLRNGIVCYRLIGPPDPFIGTEEFPQGANYSGGPIIIAHSNISGIQPILDTFPSVTTHNVTELFISTRVYKIEHPTKVLVVGIKSGGADGTQSSFSNKLFADMKIPYMEGSISDLGWRISSSEVANLLDEYDLFIFEDPGANGVMTPRMRDAIRTATTNGKNFVFIGKAMKDLPRIFRGCLSLKTIDESVPFIAKFQQTGESPSQYSGNRTFNVTNSHAIAMTPGYEDLEPMLWAEGYGSQVLFASYFRYGKGLIEVFSFLPDEQDDDMRSLTETLLGNRFVQAPPTPLQPPPPLGANGMPMPTGTVPPP